jgi:hypothetical protein
MKYIKKFESILNKIEKGDYALFHYDKLAEYSYNTKLTPELKSFINDNIGIVDIVSVEGNNWIYVIYDNVPYNLLHKFNNGSGILLDKDALVDFSKSKEDLEDKISAKKFNL